MLHCVYELYMYLSTWVVSVLVRNWFGETSFVHVSRFITAIYGKLWNSVSYVQSCNAMYDGYCGGTNNTDVQ